MPKGIDWIQFIYVNLGFVLLVFSMYYFTSIAQIKQNWSKYRCNPLFMPLSENIEQDFVYCVQTMQTNYMGYLLQPLSYITSSLTNIGGELSKDMNSARTKVTTTITNIIHIFENIFGVFLNLVIEFQKMTIHIKDLMGKIIGIVVTLMYMVDGSLKTMNSTWNGPPGQMVKALGSCFHPDTKIILQNKKIVRIQDLNLGDILENGSVVTATMKLDNKNNKEPLYKLQKGPEEEPIYVTGSHYIYHVNQYIPVRDHPMAKIQTRVQSKWYSCLITDNHTIPIGNYLFYDYEDWRLQFFSKK